MIQIKDIVAKRKKLWQKYLDGKGENVDEEFVKAAAAKILSDENLVAEIKKKPYLLIEATFTVVNKEKKTVPFFLNEVQKDFIEKYEQFGRSKPFFILKGRQQGFTTLIQAIQLSYAIVCRNFSGFTLANTDENTKAIFNDKVRMVYERLPNLLKPQEKYNSKNELFFDKLNSSWRIATATKNVGRSKTLNFIHYSEVAFFEVSLSDLQKSIGETATQDCFQVYESTANGFNEAKDLWDKESCVNLFYEWWRTNEYRSTEYEYLKLVTTNKWLADRIEFLKKKGLDKEQLTWYCKKFDSYIDKESIKQEYPCFPEEAFVSSGDCIFNKESIYQQMDMVRNLDVKVGYFKFKQETEIIKNNEGEEIYEVIKIFDINFVNDEKNGYIKIFEEPQTKVDDDGLVTHIAPYVIGGDTSGMGLDYNTAKVVNNITKCSAATLRKQEMDDEDYAKQLYCLGMYYNEALIGVETNYSIQPTKLLADSLNYPNLYVRESNNGMTRKIQKAFGVDTNRETRPQIISGLQSLFKNNVDYESDYETLKEMLTFVKVKVGNSNNKYRAEAQVGSHDDLVMALGIAHFISGQQTVNWIKKKPEEHKWVENNFKIKKAANNEFLGW